MDQAKNKLWKESFKGFYRKHSRSLWFFIYKTCSDPGLADDIFQETFYRYLRAAPVQLNEYQSKAYLFKIAYRLVIDQIRKIKTEQARFSEMGKEMDIGVETRNEREIEMALDMEKTFRLLKPKERTLLWLAYIEGCSHQEIASITNTKEKSIRVKLFRARKKFAGILRQQGYNGEEAN